MVQWQGDGTKPGELRLAFFDAFSISEGCFLDYKPFVDLTERLGLPRVPLLAIGCWNESLLTLAEGKTTFPGADHVREGFVVRPLQERWDDRVGRVCLKMIGQGYLLGEE